MFYNHSTSPVQETIFGLSLTPLEFISDKFENSFDTGSQHFGKCFEKEEESRSASTFQRIVGKSVCRGGRAKRRRRRKTIR